MPVIELIVAVCLTGAPAECSEKRFQFFDDASLFGCMVKAVPYLANWADEHPEYEVKSWKCGYPNNNREREA